MENKNKSYIESAKNYFTNVYLSFSGKGYGLHDKQVTIDEFIRLNEKWDRAYRALLKNKEEND
jgi:hypothetical protein